MLTKFGRLKKIQKGKVIYVFEKFPILPDAADGINFKTILWSILGCNKLESEAFPQAVIPCDNRE